MMIDFYIIIRPLSQFPLLTHSKANRLCSLFLVECLVLGSIFIHLSNDLGFAGLSIKVGGGCGQYGTLEQEFQSIFWFYFMTFP